jgi:hypothetical protein
MSVGCASAFVPSNHANFTEAELVACGLRIGLSDLPQFEAQATQCSTGISEVRWNGIASLLKLQSTFQRRSSRYHLFEPNWRCFLKS